MEERTNPIIKRIVRIRTTVELDCELLEEMMFRRRLKPSQLARAVGYSGVYIGELIRGDKKHCSKEFADKLYESLIP